jgi:hypothetical protein
MDTDTEESYAAALEYAAFDDDALAAYLAAAPPSAGLLDTVDVQRLSDLGRAHYLTALLRMRAHCEARLTLLLGDTDTRRPADELDPTADQVALATGWSERTARTRLARAGRLTRDFAPAVQALDDGSISMEQADILDDLTSVLDRDLARAVGAAVLPGMPYWSLRKTRAEISRAILEADPQAAGKRHAKEAQERRVELRPLPHGMAALTAYLEAERARAAYDELTRAAVKAKKHDPGEERTTDQLRLDLLEARIHGARDVAEDGSASGGANGGAGAPRAAKPQSDVLVAVPLATFAGLGQQPGELVGHGPIDAQHARELCFQQNALCRLVVIDDDGVAMAATARQYRIVQTLRMLAILLYRTCTFPDCTRPATHCDIDHRVPFGKGGWTILDNLAPLCRRHHRMKTRKKVTLERVGGALVWTLPDGQVHITRPKPYLPLRC